MSDTKIRVGDTVDIRAGAEKAGSWGTVRLISHGELFHVEIVNDSVVRIYNASEILKRNCCRFCGVCLLPHEAANGDVCDSFKCFLAEARDRPTTESTYDQ